MGDGKRDWCREVGLGPFRSFRAPGFSARSPARGRARRDGVLLCLVAICGVATPVQVDAQGVGNRRGTSPPQARSPAAVNRPGNAFVPVPNPTGSVRIPNHLLGRPGGIHFHFHQPVAPPLWHVVPVYPWYGLPGGIGFGPSWGPLPPAGGWWGGGLAPMPGGLPWLGHPPFRAGGFAQSVVIESDVRPRAALPPAQIRLINTARRELQVAVVDLRDGQQTRALRLPPGGTQTLTLERDAGAERVSLVQTYDAFGFPRVREVVSEIAPATRYEMVVHEWAVQSVAIDRTGKSPNVIEDIRHQGRGIGRFPLPPGEQLRDGPLDVYRMALAANNPGAVGPLVPDDESIPTDNASKLERAILEAQREAQRRGGR